MLNKIQALNFSRHGRDNMGLLIEETLQSKDNPAPTFIRSLSSSYFLLSVSPKGYLYSFFFFLRERERDKAGNGAKREEERES